MAVAVGGALNINSLTYSLFIFQVYSYMLLATTQDDVEDRQDNPRVHLAVLIVSYVTMVTVLPRTKSRHRLPSILHLCSGLALPKRRADLLSSCGHNVLYNTTNPHNRLLLHDRGTGLEQKRPGNIPIQ